MGYQPIENYGIIGDLHTVALVGMDGTIDFLRLPHFDSPSVFAALLDHRKGGRFQLAPVFGEARQKQLYLPDSNILLTRFLSEEGVAEISDFMPVEEAGHAHNLVRRAKTVRGEVRFRMVCEPRFDYARASHRIEQKEGTFSMCSFWYVECLSRAGDIEKARFFFEKVLGYANHLDLYAEELGPCGEHLGNFPQAFTHLALISAAYDLNRRLSAAGQEA